MKLMTLLVALAVTSSAFADLIGGDMQLRDAIYLYDQDFRSSGAKSLVGENCDVFQMVLDVEYGYVDVAYAQSADLSSALNNRALYNDRIFDWHAMFAYALYQNQAIKTFSMEDRNYLNTGVKTGQGTLFGYCYSTKPESRVYFREKDLCTNKFSDAHTEIIPSCTPIVYGTNTNPTAFSMEWLNGKVGYDVYWDGQPIIRRLSFSNGIMTFTGILNDTSSGTSAYSVDANGVLSLAAIPGATVKIVCGGNSQYLKTHSYNNGVYGRADLLFYNETAASNYAALMTGNVPACKAPE